ncbi:MAG: hypothetical protein H7X95_02895, partial [Deltaproteobacteria bacterium]|nr:hypothetical protein [Deltaproteobacteria bacterium]
MLHRRIAVPGLLLLLLGAPGCADQDLGASPGATGDPADEAASMMAGIEERRTALFDRVPSPTAADRNVTIQRLAYRCGLLDASICNNTTDDFGLGVEHLRAIPNADKED